MARLLWWVPSLLLILTSSVLARDAILIGVCLPLSGNLGTAGQLALEGIRVAHKMRPQVLDRPVDLKVADTRSERAAAANAVLRLIETDRVTAIIGETTAEIMSASYFQAERRVIPWVWPRAASLVLAGGNGYGIRACPVDADQGEQAANLALSCLYARTAAIVYDMSDEHSIGLAGGFAREFTRAGGRILLQSRIKTGDRDFMAQINQIRMARPDAIYAPLNHLECALMTRQARNMGVDATVIAGDAVHVQELIELGGKSVEDLIFTSYFHERMIQTEMGKRFRDRCTKQTGRQLHAAQIAGADAYFWILDAIAEAGSAEPTRIREALSALSCFDGVTGRTFVGKGGKAMKPIGITKVKNGRFVELRPASEREQGCGMQRQEYRASTRGE